MRPTHPTLARAKSITDPLSREYIAQLNRRDRRVQRVPHRPTTPQVRTTIFDLRLVEHTRSGETLLALLSIVRPLTTREQHRLTHGKTGIYRIMDWSAR